MPTASQSPIGTTSQDSILLIEEYDALAAAISSALRKFAPRHTVHVARSLNEARTVAKKIEPALLIIDFDPPFADISAFLQKMQEAYPDARVLLVGGKLPRDVASESRQAGAIQFVEKPFDLPDFGAAVQALLGPWTESETATRRATLRSLGLEDLLLTQCAGGRTIALEVKNDAGKSGEVHLRQGVLSHAETGRKSGAEALREMLGWREIEIREQERHRSPLRTLEADWTEILIESFREAKARLPKPPEKVEPVPPLPKTGKKIVVVDDTEMLLIFVEDVLMRADPQLQITAAVNGLDGVKEVERVTPDLVLLDYSLPDINGDEVCRRLLQNPSTAQIPILLMSGHVPEMSKAAATLDNVVATISKPFLSDALISLVHQALHEPRPVRKKPAAVRPPAPAVPVIPPPAPPPPAPPPAPAAPAPPPGSRRARIVEKIKDRARKIKPAPQPPAETPKIPAARPAAPVAKSAEPAISHPVSKPEPSASEPLQELLPLEPQEVAARKAGTPSPQTEPPIAHPPRNVPAAPPVRPSEPHPVARIPASPPRPPEPPKPTPPPRQIIPEPPQEAKGRSISTPVFSNGSNEVILGLFLDVVSVQLTPELRMGSIRARPSSFEVSLHMISPAARMKLPANGFQLGEVGLDGNGRISTIRLIPTQTPFKASQTRSALQIGAVSVVPIDSTRRVQLTPTPGAPMTLQMVANLELAGVELSPTFEISQLVLKNRSRVVQVTLNPQMAGQESNGTVCETLSVGLDHAAHITELVLNPIR